MNEPEGRAALRTLAVCLIAALGIPAAGGAAPIRDPRITRISVEEGLPDGTVYSIAQDPQGFLWLGTEYGLARYDGRGFAVYLHDPADPTSISSNQASHVFVDSEGRLWIGTWGGGLERYDPHLDGFRHYPFRADREGGLADSRVQTLFEDRDKRLWLGFNGGGLQRLDPETGELVSYRHDPGDPATLSHDRIWDVVQDAAGGIWVATSDGLDRLDPADGRVTRDAACPPPGGCLPHPEVRALTIDREQRLWVGTREGLAVVPPGGEPVDVYRRGDAGLDSDYINSFLEDRQGRLWIGTGFAGLHLWLPEVRRFRVFRHEVDANSLSNDDVRCLLEDRSGLIWIGTRGEGVNRLDPRVPFSRFRYKPDEPASGLGEHRVWDIARDDDGRIWVATQGGLDRISTDRTSIAHFRHDPADPGGLGPGEPRALMLDRGGGLWVGTSEGSLQRLSRETRDGARLAFESYPTDVLRGGDVRELVEGPVGRIWIGSATGVYALDPGSGRFWLAASDIGEPARALEFDGSGRLWIGTRGDGIDVLDPATGGLEHLSSTSADDPLARANVLSLLHDRRGTLWVGTRGDGLYRSGGPDAGIDQLTVDDGLASNVVHAIVEDERGHLWMSTNRGVSRLDPVTGRFRNYDESDGLQGNSFLPGSSYRARDGEIFFGGPNGLTTFYPAEVEASESTYVPPVVITGVRLFGRPIATELPAWELAEIELAPGDDYLSIEFAALDFTRPERNRYSYKLEGYDRDWVDSGSRREASYTNLDGGVYTFRVRGSTPAGIWNDRGAALRIRVVSPLVERGWFRLGLTLAGLVAIGLAVQVRLRGARRTRRRLEDLVLQRTAELEAKTAELEQAYRAAEEVSYTDPLTGLRNRRYLFDTIDPDVARALREHEQWAESATGPPPGRFDLVFVIADLDRFKAVNDSYGHRIGDLVLVEFASLLRARSRESDLIVRWGGEEFLLLCRFLDRKRAPAMLENLRRAVAEYPFRVDDEKSLHLTCSFGFAAFPFDPERPRALDWEQVLELADRALYEAKRSGRNTWVGLVPGTEAGREALARSVPGRVEQLLAAGHLGWLRPPGSGGPG